jgi:hypothetical protein
MATRSESRQKTELIQVRCTPDEKVTLKGRAAAFGISMGELCRVTIFGVKPKSKTDQAAIQALADARADLGRLGGLLKGWLAGSFDKETPGPKTRAEISSLLKEIDAGQKLVIQSVKKLME